MYEEEDVQDCDRYALDEVGFWDGISGNERVISRRGTKRQHVLQSGNREVTTVLAVICADGSHLPPLVVFKGERMQLSWAEHNPDHVLYGSASFTMCLWLLSVYLYRVTSTPSGYVNSEIMFNWLQWFESETSLKASGRARVLHLDSHLSHIADPFSDYASDHRIHVVGYPPKTTHGMQGLDRIHFGQMKSAWPVFERDFEHSTGHPVGKNHFLEVLHRIYERVFTPENNRKAFVITGLSRPPDPSRISELMMAPSEALSTSSSCPLPQPTPVRAGVAVLETLAQLRTHADNPTTPSHSHLDKTAQEALQISPMSMSIDPELLPPEKRTAVIACHLQLSHIQFNIPCQHSITASDRIPTPMLPNPSSFAPPSTSTPLPPDQEDPAILRAENAALHHALKSCQSAITSLGSQLVIQHEHCVGLQGRLFEKEKTKGDSNVGKYLSGGGARIYTDAAFQEARRKDREVAEGQALDKTHGTVIAAAKASRNAWRHKQLETQKREREQQSRAWEKECRFRKEQGGQAPKRPKRVEKAETPTEYTFQVAHAEGLTSEELREVHQKLEASGAVGKQERQAAALRALQELGGHHDNVPMDLDYDLRDSDSDDDGLLS